MRVSQVKEKQPDLYSCAKVSRLLPAFQQMTLSPQPGSVEIIIDFSEPHRKNWHLQKKLILSPTIRDWNALPDSITSSADGAEDCVARFASLVRAMD